LEHNVHFEGNAQTTLKDTFNFLMNNHLTETALENNIAKTTSLIQENLNSSSSSGSVSTNLSTVIGASIGGILVLITVFGIAWIFQRTRNTENHKRISATTELVRIDDDDFNGQVKINISAFSVHKMIYLLNRLSVSK
jgi:hypothetical protein